MDGPPIEGQLVLYRGEDLQDGEELGAGAFTSESSEEADTSTASPYEGMPVTPSSSAPSPSVRSITTAGGAALAAATLPTADAMWEVALTPSEIFTPVWTAVLSWEIILLCLLIGGTLGALCMCLGWCCYQAWRSRARQPADRTPRACGPAAGPTSLACWAGANPCARASWLLHNAPGSNP